MKSRGIQDQELIDAFALLTELFLKTEEIIITDKNRSIFKYLGEKLDNRSLSVAASDMKGIFYLSSERFRDVPTVFLETINDCIVRIQTKSISCNHIFASLLSKKIFLSVQHSNDSTDFDFSDFKYPDVLSSIFDMLLGLPLSLENHSFIHILETIEYLKFESFISLLKRRYEDDLQPLQHLSQYFLSGELLFSSLSNDIMFKVISSSLFHTHDEDAVFTLITGRIRSDPSASSLLKFVSGENVSSKLILDFLNSLSPQSFGFWTYSFLQDCLKFGYLIPEENETQKILAASVNLDQFIQIQNENLSLKASLDALEQIHQLSCDSTLISDIPKLLSTLKTRIEDLDKGNIFIDLKKVFSNFFPKDDFHQILGDIESVANQADDPLYHFIAGCLFIIFHDTS